MPVITPLSCPCCGGNLGNIHETNALCPYCGNHLRLEGDHATVLPTAQTDTPEATENSDDSPTETNLTTSGCLNALAVIAYVISLIALFSIGASALNFAIATAIYLFLHSLTTGDALDKPQMSDLTADGFAIGILMAIIIGGYYAIQVATFTLFGGLVVILGGLAGGSIGIIFWIIGACAYAFLLKPLFSNR